jgi:ketosteroid isomerase-like protein
VFELCLVKRNLPLQRTKEENNMQVVIAVAVAVVGAGSVVASQEADVMAPVRQFVDGFNTGDIKMIRAACADQTFIIDDFPPHEWRGSRATSKWFHDLAALGKKYDMSDPFVTLGKPRQVHVTRAHAYVVVPTNLRYNENEQLIRRTGLMTLALHKAVDGWRIAARAGAWG